MCSSACEWPGYQDDTDNQAMQGVVDLDHGEGLDSERGDAQIAIEQCSAVHHDRIEILKDSKQRTPRTIRHGCSCRAPGVVGRFN